MAQIFASDRNVQATPAAKAARSTAGRPQEQALAGLQAQADQSVATARLAQLQRMENAPMQRMEEEELMQGKMIQRMEEEEALQGKFAEPALQRQETGGSASGGGLPAPLRSGIEALSGMDMSDVQVHRNSSAPASVGAHAYAQGNDIHLGSGQEQHLPHEAWHVVQQREGRVKPTMQMAGVAINDDAGLEKEADTMGGKAAQMVASNTRA